MILPAELAIRTNDGMELAAAMTRTRIEIGLLPHSAYARRAEKADNECSELTASKANAAARVPAEDPITTASMDESKRVTTLQLQAFGSALML